MPNAYTTLMPTIRVSEEARKILREASRQKETYSETITRLAAENDEATKRREP